MGGNLTVLTKPGGSRHRPIAVGKTILRLCCKVVAASAVDEIQEYLRPVQFGVGVGGACEGIVRAVRQLFSGNSTEPYKLVVTLDISNAFNTMDRSAFAAVVRHLLPGFAATVVPRGLMSRMNVLPFFGFNINHCSRPEAFNKETPSALCFLRQKVAMGLRPALLEARRMTEDAYPNQLDIAALLLS
eukprot:2932313-Amphidinium_carterae.2